MKKILSLVIVLLLWFSMCSILTPLAKAQVVVLPWRDDFDYNTLDEMKAAGWTMDGEERISIGGGTVTLDNDGSQGSAIRYVAGFPSGVYDFNVETRSRWVGRSYGHNGNFYVYTQRHFYCWYGDGYYFKYGFTRDGNRVLLPIDYTPVLNAWTTFALEKRGNTFYMYQDGELMHTYVEPDEAPDALVRVDISCGWISTMEYDYISAHASVVIPRSSWIKLTDHAEGADSPGWSPDGSEIFYNTWDETPLSTIYKMAADGSNRASLGISEVQYPDVSPDGSKILTVGFGYVWVCNYDGSDHHHIYGVYDSGHGVPGSCHHYARWSPSGDKIAVPEWTYSGPGGQHSRIITINSDGTNPTHLTDDDHTYVYPFWSPNGAKIAYTKTSQPTLEHDIWIMDSDGQNQHRITYFEDAMMPVWSPDGYSIFFVRYYGPGFGQAHIYRMNVDGTNVEQLTDSTGEWSPAISPDGRWMAFAAVDENGQRNIYKSKLPAPAQRRMITVDNTENPDTLTNYQVLINVTYDSNMQPDFDDLRFTWYDDTSGQEVSVDYWLDKYVDSEYALVWVEVPSIRGLGQEILYMYYGDPDATSASNGEDTFVFFDGFSTDTTANYQLWSPIHGSGNPNEFSWDPNGWLFVNASIREQYGRNSNVHVYHKTAVMDPSEDQYWLESRCKAFGDGWLDYLGVSNLYKRDSTPQDVYFRFANVMQGIRDVYPMNKSGISGGWGSWEFSNSSDLPTSVIDQWFRIGLGTALDGTVNGSFRDDNYGELITLVGQTTHQSTKWWVDLVISRILTDDWATMHAYFDYVRVRKFTDPEPSYSISTPWYWSDYVDPSYKIADFEEVGDWVWENCVPLLMLNSECGYTSNWENPLDIPLPWVPDADTELADTSTHRPTWYYRVVVDRSTKSFVVQLIAYWPYQHGWFAPIPPPKCAPYFEHPNDYEPIFLYYEYTGPDFYSSLETGSYEYQYVFHTALHGLTYIPFMFKGTDIGWQDNPEERLFFFDDSNGRRHPVFTVGKAAESTNWGSTGGLHIVEGCSLPIAGWTSFAGHAYGHVIEGPVSFGELLVSVSGSSFVRGEDDLGRPMDNGFEDFWPNDKTYDIDFKNQHFRRLDDSQIDDWIYLSEDENPFKMVPYYSSRDLVNPWNDNSLGVPSVGSSFDPIEIPFHPNWHHEYVEAGTHILDARERTNAYLTLTNTESGDIFIYKYLLNPYEGRPAGYHSVYRYVEISTNIPSEAIAWPMSVRVYYDELDVLLRLIDEDSLRLFRWDGSKWSEETSSEVDTTNNYVCAETSHMGTFAIFGQPMFSSISSYLMVTANSPIDTLVTDPSGYRVGYDPTLEDILIEIPGALYSGNGSEPQITLVPSPLPGGYMIDTFGTGVGTYTISIDSLAEDGSVIATETWTDTTSPGEIDRNDVQLLEDGNVVESPPSIDVITPAEGQALQDGVTLEATVSDPTGVDWVTFSIREPDGTIIDATFEGMSPTHSGDDTWTLGFDTTQLPDGYYQFLVNASDALGNEGNKTVDFSIRNWACLELLPATEANKARRTMPVKFSLRVFEDVDPAKPFVYNEELTIKIYEQDDDGDILLQTSTYGITARDYRIDSEDELYITNFRTLKKPKTYVVEIYRKSLLIGSFEFSTVK